MNKSTQTDDQCFEHVQLLQYCQASMADEQSQDVLPQTESSLQELLATLDPDLLLALESCSHDRLTDCWSI